MLKEHYKIPINLGRASEGGEQNIQTFVLTLNDTFRLRSKHGFTIEYGVKEAKDRIFIFSKNKNSSNNFNLVCNMRVKDITKGEIDIYNNKMDLISNGILFEQEEIQKPKPKTPKVNKKNTKAERLARDQKIMKLKEKGENITDIADKVGCTRQTVYSAMRRSKDKAIKQFSNIGHNPDITDLWTIQKNLGIYSKRNSKAEALDAIEMKIQSIRDGMKKKGDN